ncbi:hypothetical protein WOLCODRAFT_133109 [Wolfiporia cocos MD-104 SS10]|uniref:DDE Tnp4 domain-containing protein n=1 Tax=Wolfiporia cocos (strain MD-104) TaxID=742152 RepID=A0A2H3K6X1_WOLCO|nr:hypothetical protein WOLCODRAFT_133109 [Wolfiporia cocos MD-104 SS10]
MDPEDSDEELLQLMFDQYMEESEDEWIEEQARIDGLVVGGFLAVIAELGRTAGIRRRALRRLYLLRADLLPNPRQGTPWLQLYHTRNNRAFITTMGLDVNTFEYLLSSGFAACWSSRVVPRRDTQDHGNPRLGRCSLDAPGALGLVLHWLTSTMREVSLQQIFALIPVSVNRYLHMSLDILLETLHHIPEAKIIWPSSHQKCHEYSRIVTRRHLHLHGAIGTADGLNLAVQVSVDEDIQNATYNGWLHSHFVSNIIAWAPLGEIIHFTINAPGSWHDARIARSLYEDLQENTPPGYYLVCDTAFPHTAASIGNRIKTPLKSNSRLPTNHAERQQLLRLNRELVSFRQAAEWGMRSLQGSFGRLRLPLPISNAALRLKLLEVVGRLHQVRVCLVGINQLRNVYEPIWREGEELDNIWYNWHDMLFKDIQRSDRVARFYHIEDNNM